MVKAVKENKKQKSAKKRKNNKAFYFVLKEMHDSIQELYLLVQEQQDEIDNLKSKLNIE